MNIPTRRPRNPLHRLRTLPSSALPLALRHSFRTIWQKRRLLGSRPRGDGLGGEFGDGVVAYVYAWFVLGEDISTLWAEMGEEMEMEMEMAYAGGCEGFATLDAGVEGFAAAGGLHGTACVG